VKEAVLNLENPPTTETADSPTEQLNGSFVHLNHNGDEHHESAGYQIALSEASPLDNGSYANDANAADINPNRTVPPGGLNFFQLSELESEAYPTSTHGGFPSQGISFLQESELGSHQPHEPYNQSERADEAEDLEGSPQLPPVQTFTESEAPPIVNLGVGSFAEATTGEAGNAAAEKIVSQSQRAWEPVESKSDWAEEASPTTEVPPALPEKKKEDEWTTQGGRHSRHQSQQRGGRGGGSQRGGRGEWRGGEGRGGSRGGYRGGRGGERGAPNGERRGSWRGGERGRGRGGNNLPPTAV
jgi:hypothetical protein